MGRGWIVLAAAAAAATCYSPHGAAPCTVSCDFGGTTGCPDNLQCFSDGVCHAPGQATCTPDAAILADSSIDTPSGSQGSACYGSGDVRVCLASALTGTAMVQTNIDTDNATGCTIIDNPVAGPASICAITGAAIMVPSGAFHASGSRPLVLIADFAITIDGDLSVASDTTLGLAGAGRDLTCMAAKGANGTGAGGGAGASHGTLGGPGGDGTSVNGAMPAAVTTSGVVGGCTGGAGGDSGHPGGLGGLGGGAVYLIARNLITVSTGARINASGAGGFAGDRAAGGGGGGAGGFIGFDAPTITIDGVVVAAGGGGGGGGDDNTPGNSSGSTSYTCGGGGAPGGGGGLGGAGGAGGLSTDNGSTGNPGQNTGSISAGGGGGGGGTGVIHMFGGTSANSCPTGT